MHILDTAKPTTDEDLQQTVLLCGVRDVRDYRIHNGDNQVITGGSAFNIKSKSLRLGNFSHDHVAALYAQHTEETGQAFENGVIDYVFEQTNGQPWLVNALANEACFEKGVGRDRSRPITLTDMAVPVNGSSRGGISTSTSWPTSCGSPGYAKSSVSSWGTISNPASPRPVKTTSSTCRTWD